MTLRDNSLGNIFIRAYYFTAVFFLSFAHFQNLIFTDTPTTLKLHMKYAKRLAHSRSEILPHEGFFRCLIFMHKFLGLSFEYSTILLQSLALTACAIIVYLILKSFLRKDYSDSSLLVITTILLTVSAIYVPFFSKYIYKGQGGPNVIHNSTNVVLRPFAIAGFFMVSQFFEQEYRRRSLAYCGLTAVVLLVGVYIKPSLLLVLLPAVAIYILVKHTRKFDIYWKMFLILLPGCLALLYQRQIHTATMGRDVGISFLTVWRTFSPNVGVSIIITLAFPFSVLIFRFKSSLKNDYVVISWLMTIFGILQFALLTETKEGGQILTSGNWIGGYLTALTMLFISAAIVFFQWLKTADTAKASERLAMTISSILLALHTFSGVIYFIRLYIERDPFLVR